MFIPFPQRIAIMDNGILDKIEETPDAKKLDIPWWLRYRVGIQIWVFGRINWLTMRLSNSMMAP